MMNFMHKIKAEVESDSVTGVGGSRFRQSGQERLL